MFQNISDVFSGYGNLMDIIRNSIISEIDETLSYLFMIILYVYDLIIIKPARYSESDDTHMSTYILLVHFLSQTR